MAASTVDSKLMDARRKYIPTVPEVLTNLATVTLEEAGQTSCVGNERELRGIFQNLFGQPTLACGRSEEGVECPALRIGFVLSGGPAAGGHNVVCGLWDALKEMNEESVLIGFQRGPRGLFENNHQIIDQDTIDTFRNTGGFNMVGTGRDKIETDAQLNGSLQTVTDLELNGLLVIGGDDSNTNACLVGEFFAQNDCPCKVVGIPKTIDGDLQNEDIEISFGFHTATRTYSEMVSNICRDACSAVKAWHFIKLMGRDASHVTLETALQTQPNVALISEEVKHEGLMLADVVDIIADTVCARAEQNKNYGVVLVPEGLLQFIPSMNSLIQELNHILANGSANLLEMEALDTMTEKLAFIRSKLGHSHGATFDMLPVEIQRELINERDPHGNVQVSRIPTELLLVRCVEQELKVRKRAGRYNGKFKAHGHFFGYGGRCGFPSNFDSQYCYNLGRVGALLVRDGFSGYMARVFNLANSPDQWGAGATPLTSMMNMELRHGKMKPVIKKALVDVENEPAMEYFQANRDSWSVPDAYRMPGPLQYFGPTELCDEPPMILRIRQNML